MDVQVLEQFVFDRMAATGLPGLSVAVVEGDAVVWQRGFGRRDLDTGDPATPETLYSIGSVTKSLTALAVLQLAERGTLSLEDLVEQHLPLRLRPRGGTIRIEHLLTHTLGLPALAYSEALSRHTNRTGGRPLPLGDVADVMTFMADAEAWAEAAPGERWMYANEGYALLGAIVQARTGMSYEQYVAEQILQPLGMDRSVFGKAQVDAAAEVATPYVLSADKQCRPGRYVYRPARSEGGLVSSVADLAKYLAFWLTGDDRIVSAETRHAMTRPRVAKPYREVPSLFGGAETAEPASHYGYGLEITPDFFGTPLVGHGGSVMVATAYLGFLPEKGLGVAILANASGYPPARMGQFILAHCLGEEPASLPFLRMEATEALTGAYETYKGTMRVDVARRGDFLELIVADREQPMRIILVPERIDAAEARYFTLAGGQRLDVIFRRRGEAEPIELVYERYKLRRVGPA